jgi:hypothetical protein
MGKVIATRKISMHCPLLMHKRHAALARPTCPARQTLVILEWDFFTAKAGNAHPTVQGQGALFGPVFLIWWTPAIPCWNNSTEKAVECTGQAKWCTHYMTMCTSEALRSTLVAARHCLVLIILQAQSVSNNFHTHDQICILAAMYQNMIHHNQHSHLVSCESDGYAPLHFCSKDVKNNNMIIETEAIFWTEDCAPFRWWQLLHSSIPHHPGHSAPSCVNPLEPVTYR